MKVSKMGSRHTEEPNVEEQEFSVDDVQLFRVTFRRKPPVVAQQSRQRSFITFGTTEDDAMDRVWNTFKGTSFHKDFERTSASAELVVGKIMKVGG